MKLAVTRLRTSLRTTTTLAVLAALLLITVPETMGQVSDQQNNRPEQTTLEQQVAAPEKTAQQAGAPRWSGPIFTLMAKMTENSKDTGVGHPGQSRAIRDH